VDPFLLLDEMGPAEYGPGEALGAPDHPHRGFETVTYALEGEFEHEDSAGHRGKLGPGDVQWMTAGAGVVHSEMPSRRIREEGGRVHGFQIWVNLPARDKMTRPRYQEIPAARIPAAATEDGLAEVRVIAGEALGARAVIETRTPIVLQDWTLSPGARVVQPVPADHEAFVYVFQGAALVGDGAREVKDGQLARLGRGGAVALASAAGAAGPARLLLLAGVPLREPVARYGPFVMNSEAEIRRAIVDYQAVVPLDLIIRPAQRDELDAVARLAGKLVRMHHALDEHRFFLSDRVEEGYAWWFGCEIDRDGVVLLVAERAGVIVGYAYGRLEERDWNQLLDAHGALHDVWVEEGERRCGVARRLVEAAVAALVARGAPRVVLHTAAGNAAAQALFARLGFRTTMVEMTREVSAIGALDAASPRS
jgi:quercetin 2,3-dioxygenase